MSALDMLLNRLENPKPYGPGYRAACPACESSSKTALSLKAADDGRVLLKCFAGCSALDVVHSLGLELADLFEKPITTNPTPQQRREWHDKAKIALWKSCRNDLIIEMNILLLAAGDIYRGREVSKSEMDRMLLAGKRWRNALGEL